MKNVTISVDEETARWARIEAARRGTSVSRLIGEILRERRLSRSDYDAAMERFMARPSRPLKQPNESYPDRKSLYDRPVLR